MFDLGAVFFKGRIHLMLWVQGRSRSTSLVMASSSDGVHFEVAQTPVYFEGLERESRPISHGYDPRLTVIDDEIADTCVGLCTTTVADLLAACVPVVASPE